MQVKLWDANKSGLQKIVDEPAYKRLGVSIAKIANIAIASYITAQSDVNKSKKK